MINLAIFNFINGAAGHYRALDAIMLFITQYVTYIVSIAVVLYVVVWLPFREQEIHKRLLRMKYALECTIALVVTWCTVEVLKTIVAEPRPFTTLSHINALLPHEHGYSFPSGHATMTIAIATLVFFTNRRLGFLLYGFALVVIISRMYVGVHYFTDVAVGALLGFALPAVLHLLVSRKRPRTAPHD